MKSTEQGRIFRKATGPSRKAERRMGALMRLTEQLRVGTTHQKTSEGKQLPKVVPLHESDRKRIEKEIAILRTKLHIKLPQN